MNCTGKLRLDTIVVRSSTLNFNETVLFLKKKMSGGEGPNLGRFPIGRFAYRMHEVRESEIVSAQLPEDTGISKRKSGLLGFFLRGSRFSFEPIWNGEI